MGYVRALCLIGILQSQLIENHALVGTEFYENNYVSINSCDLGFDVLYLVIVDPGVEACDTQFTLATFDGAQDRDIGTDIMGHML